MTDNIVTTRYGKVRGIASDGCVVFKGIPFAMAPTGTRRFRPPEEPEPWSGVRSAVEASPIAPQPESALGSYVPGDPTAQDEDCLTINVWTPGCDDKHRPVMVFIHGGAYLIGSGAQVMYDGVHFARRGVVLVTFNYRLGVLGYLADPELSDTSTEGIGNYGLRDQIAALCWVRDNIESFGGAPGNVTIFGESAGAMSVCDLLGIPKVKGLFQRAIAESGSSYAVFPQQAIPTSRRLAQELGIKSNDRRVLETVPVGEIIAAQGRISSSIDSGIGMPFRPVVDGHLMKRHPAEEISDGCSAGVDLIVGTNRDEFRFFSVVVPELHDLDDVGVGEIIRRYLVGGGLVSLDPADVMATYRTARQLRGDDSSPGALLDAIVTDWIFRVPQLRLAAAHLVNSPRTYAYLFDWESPFADGALKACHALELPFVFGTVSTPVIGWFAGSTPEAMSLSESMMSAWASFAANGVPRLDSSLEWPRYEPTRRATMRFGESCTVHDAPYETERAFFDGHLGRYGDGGPSERAKPPAMALLVSPATNRAGT